MFRYRNLLVILPFYLQICYCFVKPDAHRSIFGLQQNVVDNPKSLLTAYSYKSQAKSKMLERVRLPDLSQRDFPDVSDEPYDLIVIGSGPGGETLAVQAAQLGARVAVIEQKAAFGGPTGLTSKAVREATKQIVTAVEKIGGDKRKQIRKLWSLRFPALRSEAEVLQARESRDRLAKNMCDLFIGEAEFAKPRDDDDDDAPVSLRVCRSSYCIEIKARHACIATGSRPARPTELAPGVPVEFDQGYLVDATQMGKLAELPNAAAVIGGGVIAVEYATVLAKLGVGVSLLCPEDGFMRFLPAQVRETLRSRMIRDKILLVHSPIQRIDRRNDGLTRILLEDGKRLRVDLILYSGGRDANSENLGTGNVGVDTGRYGRILVRGADYKTTNPAIHAIGDVVGPPGLASSAAQQARAVADALFKQPMMALGSGIGIGEDVDGGDNMEDYVDDEFFADVGHAAGAGGDGSAGVGGAEKTLFGDNMINAPLTLWTIPEISSVGLSTEQAIGQFGLAKYGGNEQELEQLTDREKDKILAGWADMEAEQQKQEQKQEQKQPDGGDTIAKSITMCGGRVVCGYGYFKDLARGRLSGDLEGFLKIIAVAESPSNHKIVGVQIMGDGANELIQLGSILVYSGATLEQVSKTPFAAVTLSGLYQMACDDALCNTPYNLRRHPSRDRAFRIAYAQSKVRARKNAKLGRGL